MGRWMGIGFGVVYVINVDSVNSKVHPPFFSREPARRGPNFSREPAMLRNPISFDWPSGLFLVSCRFSRNDKTILT
jgi:hypothetical protein